MSNHTRFFPVVVPALLFLMSCAPIIPEKQVVFTDSAPKPIGRSSQAIKTGNSLYIAGQFGVEPGREQLVPGGILGETQQALRNIDAVLRRADYARHDVVRMDVYLTNVNDYQTVQSVFDNYFTNKPPTVNFMEVNRLPRGAMVSITVTATR